MFVFAGFYILVNVVLLLGAETRLDIILQILNFEIMIYFCRIDKYSVLLLQRLLGWVLSCWKYLSEQSQQFPVDPAVSVSRPSRPPVSLGGQ